jgi:hypothetical protein
MSLRIRLLLAYKQTCSKGKPGLSPYLPLMFFVAYLIFYTIIKLFSNQISEIEPGSRLIVSYLIMKCGKKIFSKLAFYQAYS